MCPSTGCALEGVLPEPEVRLVRTVTDLRTVDALFLPGGESTTIARLLEASGLWTALEARLNEGMPVLATCAGLILLSRALEPSPSGRDPPTMGYLDIRVRRNDYGRQRESFEAPVRLSASPDRSVPGRVHPIPAHPRSGTEAKPIAFRGSEVVGVRSGTRVGIDLPSRAVRRPRVHRAFLAGGVRSQEREAPEQQHRDEGQHHAQDEGPSIGDRWIPAPRAEEEGDRADENQAPGASRLGRRAAAGDRAGEGGFSGDSSPANTNGRKRSPSTKKSDGETEEGSGPGDHRDDQEQVESGPAGR